MILVTFGRFSQLAVSSLGTVAIEVDTTTSVRWKYIFYHRCFQPVPGAADYYSLLEQDYMR